VATVAVTVESDPGRSRRRLAILSVPATEPDLGPASFQRRPLHPTYSEGLLHFPIRSNVAQGWDIVRWNCSDFTCLRSARIVRRVGSVAKAVVLASA
jgi:hypothetical protein